MSVQGINKERGATLLVSMIMLVVLTLLVVFAIRSGNTNLRIAGNAQSQAEADLATRQAIEQVMEQVNAVADPSLIPEQSVAVSTGPVSYTVTVQAMTTCILEKPVLNSTLDANSLKDRPCFATQDDDKAVQADGSLPTKPSECKTQQWEIAAGVTDSTSAAKVSEVQGITIRVPAVVTCK